MPFQICDGSFRRKQTYRGELIEKAFNSSIIQLPVIKKDGVQLPNTGGILTVKGLGSGIRGLKVGKLRPDVVVCDDWQTSETADNPEQIQKMLDLLHKDVMNLSAKGKIAILFTATPIQPEDLVEQIERDINWKTTKYKAIIQFPDDIIESPDDGLWMQYFKMYDGESMDD